MLGACCRDAAGLVMFERYGGDALGFACHMEPHTKPIYKYNYRPLYAPEKKS